MSLKRRLIALFALFLLLFVGAGGRALLQSLPAGAR
ncbi:CHASE3 domain sensor protein [Azospirillum melinis]|nr:CHASE3 domain sensor protein [Azospirillum melinis]